MNQNWNEAVQQLLAQGRDFQSQLSDALNKTAEDLKPHLQATLQQAQELQATLGKHALQTSDLASQQAQTAVGHLNDFVKIGAQAVKESADQARVTAAEMAERARRIVEAAAAAAAEPPTGKTPK
jgi:methyl-accepting chemotaxis protein